MGVRQRCDGRAGLKENGGGGGGGGTFYGACG